MGAKIQAFDIFQTPLSSHYPLPLRTSTVFVSTMVFFFELLFIFAIIPAVQVKLYWRNYTGTYWNFLLNLYLLLSNINSETMREFLRDAGGVLNYIARDVM
jgi:hypothetical protein